MEQATIPDILATRAKAHPKEVIYSYVGCEGERDELTIGELYRRASIAARSLRDTSSPGDRAVVICRPGLKSVIDVFACFYAQIVAVLVPPPRHRNDHRFAMIARDCGATLLLDASPDRHSDVAPDLLRPTLYQDYGGVEPESVDVSADSLALLQYTSGSTGSPRGVMLSHKNLLSNCVHMHNAFGLSAKDHCLLWLPLYHDMGLMSGILQPIYSEFPSTLFSASMFSDHPMSWLELISELRASLSGAPNFAYELCAELKNEARRDLDLSTWRIAFNGSEVVRAETLTRFAEAFEQCKFCYSAFRPCYGLAEATLLVSTVQDTVTSCAELCLSVDRDSLQVGRVVEVNDQAETAAKVVSVGKPVQNQVMRIVDPSSGRPCPEDRVGEIWLSSPNVAEGYWNRPEETKTVFGSQLLCDEKRYLRTGDFGFIRSDNLFIAGRLKDVIIIRGRNHHPEDVEATVRSSHPSLSRGRGASFSSEVNGEEQLVIVQEVRRASEHFDSKEVLDCIRRNVADLHEIIPYQIVLVRTGSIPKTSSGKVQRSACRAAYELGRLKIVARSEKGARLNYHRMSVDFSSCTDRSQVRDTIDTLLGIGNEVDRGTRLSAFGFDSLIVMQIKMLLESKIGHSISTQELVDMRLTDIEDKILSPDAVESKNSQDMSPIFGDSEIPLSEGQKALWFLSEVNPADPSLVISRRLRIRGPLSRSKLQSALHALARRHPILCSRIRMCDSGPCYSVSDSSQFQIHEYDARDWDDTQLESNIRLGALEAFNLEKGSLVRFRLYERRDEFQLLLCIHHIVIDLWSLRLLTEELAELYSASDPRIGKDEHEPIPDYRDFVAWQSRLLSGTRGTELWEYWRKRLADHPATNSLKIGPQNQSNGTAAVYRFSISSSIARSLEELGRLYGCSLNSVILTAFECLLYRYTGGDSALMGVLSAGRTSLRWSRTVGYFANPIVLGPTIMGPDGFAKNLRATHKELVEALDHSDFPFATIVRKLHPTRDRRQAPLAQVMCMLYPSGTASERALAPFALGCTGGSIAVGDLYFESMDWNIPATQFDLTLVAGECEGGIEGAIHFDTGRFAEDAIAGMVSDYITLIEAIIRNPEQSVDSLPLLSNHRMNELLESCKGEEVDIRAERFVHKAIEEYARQHPSATALIVGRLAFTYEEVMNRANHLAGYLRNMGIGPESAVGILIGRSVDLVVAILGVLQAGGAYVPLDPSNPAMRNNEILERSCPVLLLTSERLRREQDPKCQRIVCLDNAWSTIEGSTKDRIPSDLHSSNLAYIMHTSGSTGIPKGVMISHRNVMNLFRGLDEAIGCGEKDTLLAVTSVAFDISVLEILWTLSRGCRVVLANEASTALAAWHGDRRQYKTRPTRFSLFYFGTADSDGSANRYRLVLEGARLADRLALEAVWTPERHFHNFGGLFPNPSVTSAAIAATTTRVHVRAGSVVLPLQDPIRVAEEWAVVDNISRGRVGIAFASGWHTNDFVLQPDHYAGRRQVMLDGIDVVRRLWRGDPVTMKNGSGHDIQIATYPRPIQKEIPLWLTSGGTIDTFVSAAQIDANILTHLLGQDIQQVSERLKIYREQLQKANKDPDRYSAVLMLHTYLGESVAEAKDKSIRPLAEYLRKSADLAKMFVRHEAPGVDIDRLGKRDLEDVLTQAAERFMRTGGLFGTIDSCGDIVSAARESGVSEIACFIDFGIDTDEVLQSVERIAELQERVNAVSNHYLNKELLATQIAHNNVTILQTTPSMLRTFIADPETKRAIGGVKTVLIGGELVPTAIVQEIMSEGVERIWNMYGPTETTVWSAANQLDEASDGAPIGGAIVNTQIYILDPNLECVPPGTMGEIYIGGGGLARGYFADPGQTAERFVPDPISKVSGERLYRSGDVGYLRKDGKIEIVGRADQQIKLRGYRIELGDVESVLNKCPGVEAGIAIKHTSADGEERLVAYVTPSSTGNGLKVEAMRAYMRLSLPYYMVPSAFHVVDGFPMSSNGKIDRRRVATGAPASDGRAPDGAVDKSDLEEQIASVWKHVLGIRAVSLDDNFFDVGGHSLLMIRLHQELQERLSRQFPLVNLLEHATIRLLARHLLEASDDASLRPTERASKQKAAILRRRAHMLNSA